MLGTQIWPNKRVSSRGKVSIGYPTQPDVQLCTCTIMYIVHAVESPLYLVDVGCTRVQ